MHEPDFPWKAAWKNTSLVHEILSTSVGKRSWTLFVAKKSDQNNIESGQFVLADILLIAGSVNSNLEMLLQPPIDAASKGDFPDLLASDKTHPSALCVEKSSRALPDSLTDLGRPSKMRTPSDAVSASCKNIRCIDLESELESLLLMQIECWSFY